MVVAVGLLCVWWSLLPFLRWRARTYTVTTQRLRTRDGIVSRSGLSLPLLRVNDVSYQRSLVDRVFGCGTLVLQTAAEGALVLRDVPEVERVHLVLTDLVLAAGAGQRPDDAQLAEASESSSVPARRLTRRARRQ
ncbi:MAG TPA: PH domain-containing protein, partial [Actinomycetales bacterium]